MSLTVEKGIRREMCCAIYRYAKKKKKKKKNLKNTKKTKILYIYI